MKSIHWKAAAIFAPLLCAVYFFTRYALPMLYTPEWASRHLFWAAAAVIFIGALLGRVRFAVTALSAYAVGLAAGELLGGFQAHIPPQYPHYGWLICVGVFAAGCALGAWLQHRSARAG